MRFFEDNNTKKVTMTYCRLYATQVVIEIIARSFNIVILLLFFYMAAEVIKPPGETDI